MKIEIKQLTPELIDDYFDFFDNRAFTDDSPYRCYCQLYQMTKEQYQAEYSDPNTDFGAVSRKIAEQQIRSGALRGYLAFVDGLAIGWCNANDRSNFPVESCTNAKFYSLADKKEKAVVCFEIAPEFRRKGVATALLQRVLDDATAKGYIAVESFPVVRDKEYEWDCTGPVHLYEKLGFVKVSEQKDNIIMRKELTKK